MASPAQRLRPVLRLVTADDCGQLATQTVPPQRPTAQSRLSEFFEWWFLPLILESERNVSGATIRVYREALAWWIRLTGDPPLVEIDDICIARFRKLLRRATYKRSRFGKERPLSKARQHLICAQLNAILDRTGPRRPRMTCAALLDEPPHIKTSKARSIEAKPPFALARARRIIIEAGSLEWGPKPGGASRPIPPCSLGELMQAYLMVLYYTGLRTGTVLRLRWRHVRRTKRGAFLRIPARLVTKTHKGMRKYLHPDALAALERIHAQTGSDRLVPFPYSYSWITQLHERIQRQAFPQRKPLSQHAWRRTHGTQMHRVGAAAGIRVAQKALDHADDATTRQYYVRTEPVLIRRLPSVAPPPADPQQVLF